MISDQLGQGIEILCKNDNNINSLFASRKEEIITLLANYIDEIELFNHAYGLVGAENTEELVIRHILDSLAPVGIFSRLLFSLCAANHRLDVPPIYRIADAGSGAGLPGIPLAIAMPACEFSLIERMGRRAGFLRNTKAVLSLSNINIEEIEIEKAPKKNDFKGRFDLLTYRAFKPLDAKLLKTLFTICAPNGIIAAYKGKKEKIEAETAHLLSKNNELKWEVIPYSVPFLNEERHILTIKKN